ncbi:MAG: hypothetical protein WCH39_22660, partial [Schlesneria sp.]
VWSCGSSTITLFQPTIGSRISINLSASESNSPKLSFGLIFELQRQFGPQRRNRAEYYRLAQKPDP